MKVIYLFAVAGLLSTAAVAQTQQLQSIQQAPSGTALPGAASKLQNLKMPNLSEAGKAIDNAKAALDKSPSDYGGHKVKAIAALTQAQNELKEAQKYADQHGNK